MRPPARQQPRAAPCHAAAAPQEQALLFRAPQASPALITPLPPPRRKQRQLEAQMTELGMEALDERLQSATQVGGTT